MQLLSLFSGIGAFEKALDNLHIPYELVGYCEIDKYASKSYAAIHNVPEAMNLGDITKVNERALPKNIDLITYGFPCQDISLAGKQKGLFNADGTQTRSGLFFEALRIIEETQPGVAIAENVKNLVGKKFKEQFHIVLDALEQAGYNNYWQVLNAKDYGIPQNRERVFIVSIRKDIDTGMFQFPKGFPLQLRLKDLLEDAVDEKFYLKNVDVEKFVKMDSANADDQCIQVGFLNRPTTHDFSNRVYSPDGIARTLMGTGGNQNDKAGQYLVRPSVVNVGNVNPSGKGMNGTVIDSEGLARTITQEKGEGQKILVRQATKQGYAECEVGGVADLSYPNSQTRRGRVQEGGTVCPTITAESNGLCKVEITEPMALDEQNQYIRQDGCVGTLTTDGSSPKHNNRIIEPNVLTPKRTEYGKAIRKAYEQGEVQESRHNMTELHPRTDGISNTLTTVQKDNYVVEPFIVASRGRNPENPSDRTVGSPTVQRYEPNSQGICNTLTTVQKDNYVAEPTFINGDVSKTVRSSGHGSTDRHSWDMVECKNSLRIRKLTPKECFRLMGFDDSDFEKAEKVNSNTQLYKQAGNSIVVQVLEHLLNALVECGAFGGKPKEQEVVGQLSFCDNASLERYIEKEIKQCAF